MSEQRIQAIRDRFLTSPLIGDEAPGALLSLSGQFAKIKKAYAERFRGELSSMRVAVLAEHSVEHFSSVLQLFLAQQGIVAELYLGPYNGIASEIRDTQSGLYKFEPNVLILLTHVTGVKAYPRLLATESEVDAWATSIIDKWDELWALFRTRTSCQLLQSNYVKPIARQLGNLEANYAFSQQNCISLLNAKLACRRPGNVTIVDLEYIASLIGRERWFSESDYFVSKQGFSFDVFGRVANAFSMSLASIAGRPKKCLVLDLDNTLWGGVVGDDGIDGINVDPNAAVGESFLEFQRYVKLLKDRGVILAVCSKNDEKIARAAFEERPEMILKLTDFACFIANWEHKSANLQEIAARLNIGLDALVFFDDNPAERALVRRLVPSVTVVEVPEDSAHFVRALDRGGYFDWTEITREDLGRSDSYVSNAQREQLLRSAATHDDFLSSLKMRAKCGQITAREIPRCAQLLNKTNQFNLRTRRYAEAELEATVNSRQHVGFFIELSDLFGHYGIISCVILEKQSREVFIDTWVMSCRVFKRGVEDFVFSQIVDFARRESEIEYLTGEHIATPKNGVVSELLPSLGFEETAVDAVSGRKRYRADLRTLGSNRHFIEIMQ